MLFHSEFTYLHLSVEPHPTPASHPLQPPKTLSHLNKLPNWLWEGTLSWSSMLQVFCPPPTPNKTKTCNIGRCKWVIKHKTIAKQNLAVLTYLNLLTDLNSSTYKIVEFYFFFAYIHLVQLHETSYHSIICDWKEAVNTNDMMQHRKEGQTC